MPQHGSDSHNEVRGAEPSVVVLEKGRHQWRFSCAPGEERSLMDAAISIAHDPCTRFDLQDAAVVCREIEALHTRGIRRSVIRQTDPPP